MEMNSFYGGLPGQDFHITYLFTSKYGTTESLKSDLQRGWQSLIPVGSMVAISYGLPGDKEAFEENKKKDIDTDGMSYNSTLWRKEYNETDEDSGNGLIYTIAEANGLKYRLIASMTGNTPTIRVHANNSLHANGVPKAEIADGSDVDNPLIEFSFPVEQLLALGDVTLTGANGRVDVQLNDSDIDHPKLNFWLPQSQKFEKTYIVWVDAGTPDVPKVEVLLQPDESAPELTGDATELTPILKFTLPKTPEFLRENITFDVINANKTPYIIPDLSDPNFPKIKFMLPQAQVMGKPTTNVIAPDGQPKVTINNGDINAPFLEFDLPRGIKFYYGDKVGARTDTGFVVTDETFSGYGVGDYYVHLPSGYLYKVVGVNGTTVTFDYIGCLQAPKPDVSVTPLNPFTNKLPTKPTVSQEVSAEGWSLTFGIPEPPVLIVNPDIEVGPLDDSNAGIEVIDDKTAELSFKIPRGSRIFSGLDVNATQYDTHIDGAKPGDLYLNTDTGMTYILQKSGIWEIQTGSLKGPIGDALHIVRNYEIEGEDNFETGKQYIINNYIDEEGDPLPYKPDEIFAVTFTEPIPENERELVQTAYWYFYTEDGTWGRVQLTAGTVNFIENTYQESPPESPITTKTYSIDYINSLIGGNLDPDTMCRTAFSKDQIYHLLTWEENEITPDIPVPENHDTLSAEEFIELLSWHNTLKLLIKI